MLAAAFLLLFAEPGAAVHMAKALGIGVDEAEARLRLLDRLSIFELRARGDPDFAGAYVEHEPRVAAVVLFKGDAAAKLGRYAGSTDGFVARGVTYSLADLGEARDAAEKTFAAAGVVPTAIDLDIEANRVDARFVDPAPARRLKLPAAVVLSAVEGDMALGPQRAGAVMHFPQARHPGPSMRALVTGTLFERSGCIRIGDPAGESRLVLWPSAARLVEEGGTVIVVSGGRLALGSDVSLGGGAGAGPPPPGWLLEPVTAGCEGPYWIASQSW